MGQEGPRGTQDNTGYDIAFGCLQKLDGKTLLLRHHSLQIQESERQTLTGKLSLFRLPYTAPDAAMEDAGATKS